MEYSLFFLFDHYPELGKTEDQHYATTIEQCVKAEALGYHAVYFSEHHFKPYGIVANPYILLTAVAMQTKTLQLGSAISITPLHIPVNIAEDVVMLDLISKGRAILGVGSGFLRHEFEGFGLDVRDKRKMFDDSLQILDYLFSGETINIDGGYFRGKNVCLNASPYKNRNIPMHVAAVSKEAAYYIGRQGRNIFSTPFNSLQAKYDDLKLFVDNYKRGIAESGKIPGQHDCIVQVFCHVADTDELAEQNIAIPFSRYVQTRDLVSYDSSMGIGMYHEFKQRGFIMSGSPETVTEKIIHLHHQGVENVMLFHTFGGLDDSLATRSIELFAKEVMPAVDTAINASTLVTLPKAS